jgi:hypothetical protein
MIDRFLQNPNWPGEPALQIVASARDSRRTRRATAKAVTEEPPK